MKTKDLDSIFGSRNYEEQILADADELMFGFVSIIDRLMESRNISKKELAAKVGTSPAYITQLFRGHKMINLEMIAKMQMALEIKFEIKLEGEERAQNLEVEAFVKSSNEEITKSHHQFSWGKPCVEEPTCGINIVA